MVKIEQQEHKEIAVIKSLDLDKLSETKVEKISIETNQVIHIWFKNNSESINIFTNNSATRIYISAIRFTSIGVHDYCYENTVLHNYETRQNKKTRCYS